MSDEDKTGWGYRSNHDKTDDPFNRVTGQPKNFTKEAQRNLDSFANKVFESRLAQPADVPKQPPIVKTSEANLSVQSPQLENKTPAADLPIPKRYYTMENGALARTVFGLVAGPELVE